MGPWATCRPTSQDRSSSHSPKPLSSCPARTACQVSRFELKWDGFRAGAVCRGGEVRLWSRNGKDFTAKFPDIQAALTAHVAVDCVLDGELVVWTGDRMDFDALQQRMVNTAATIRRQLAPIFRHFLVPLRISDVITPPGLNSVAAFEVACCR